MEQLLSNCTQYGPARGRPPHKPQPGDYDGRTGYGAGRRELGVFDLSYHTVLLTVPTEGQLSEEKHQS